MAAVQTIETAFCCNIDGLHKNVVYWHFLSADLEMMAQQWKIKRRDLFQSLAWRPQDSGWWNSQPKVKTAKKNDSNNSGTAKTEEARKLHFYGWFIKLINFHFVFMGWRWIVMDNAKELDAICRLKYLTWESLCWRLMEWTKNKTCRSLNTREGDPLRSYRFTTQIEIKRQPKSCLRNEEAKHM